MTPSTRRLLVPALAVGLVGASLASPAAGASGPPAVTVRVTTGHNPVGGFSYVRYPAGATISGSVTTPAWYRISISGGSALMGLSCPSTTLCVATDQSGDVLTTAQPAGGPSAWQRRNVDGSAAIGQVSCPSVTLCVAVDNQGDIVASTDPGAASAVWTVTNVDATNDITAISCPSSALCVAV